MQPRQTEVEIVRGVGQPHKEEPRHIVRYCKLRKHLGVSQVKTSYSVVCCCKLLLKHVLTNKIEIPVLNVVHCLSIKIKSL